MKLTTLMAITMLITYKMEHIKEVLQDIMKENIDHPKVTPLNTFNIFDIEIKGIDMKDSPDFSDAYISRAFYYEDVFHERELTNEECAEIQETDSEWFYEKVYEEAYGE